MTKAEKYGAHIRPLMAATINACRIARCRGIVEPDPVVAVFAALLGVR